MVISPSLRKVAYALATLLGIYIAFENYLNLHEMHWLMKGVFSICCVCCLALFSTEEQKAGVDWLPVMVRFLPMCFAIPFVSSLDAVAQLLNNPPPMVKLVHVVIITGWLYYLCQRYEIPDALEPAPTPQASSDGRD